FGPEIGDRPRRVAGSGEDGSLVDLLQPPAERGVVRTDARPSAAQTTKLVYRPTQSALGFPVAADARTSGRGNLFAPVSRVPVRHALPGDRPVTCQRERQSH